MNPSSMLKAQRNHYRSPSLLLGLAMPAALSAGLACSAADEDGGTTVPDFIGSLPGATAPTGTPGGGLAPAGAVPSAPGAAAPSAGAPAGGGIPEAQNGSAPLAPNAAPGTPGGSAPMGGEAAPVTPGAPVDPAAPADPAQPAAPGGPVVAANPASVFTNGAWSGPVRPEAVFTGTTVNPTSFDNRAEGEPFCIQGSVAADTQYRGVARLTFTLDQPDGSAPRAVVPQAQGIAFNFTRSTGSLVRVILQPPAGAGGAPAEGWCYAIPEVRGQVFVPYSEFSESCFNRPSGAAYARQPIEAISFIAPGDDEQPIDYDFCVTGIADAANASAAPAAPAGFFDGDISGTLRASFERAVVADDDGRKYVVQNNGWGNNYVANSQLITYRNNSFTVMRGPQGGTSNEPLTFPSIYVGQSGFIDGNDAVSTRINDNLPMQISQINAIPTRFAHNANNVDANATYDVWFAPQPPTAEYQTATGAFLMVWTYKPGNRNAIGNQVRTATVEGQQWQVFVGPRGSGQGATGADANAPVISYVKQGAPIVDYSFDLKAFIDDAVRSGNLNGNLFLTDVFAGFEIWGGGQGLSVTNFTVDVQGG